MDRQSLTECALALGRDRVQVSLPDPMVLELRRLTAAIEAQREETVWLHRRLLDRDDARTGAALVPLAAEVHGGTFTPAELLAASLNDHSAAGEALREIVRDYLDADGGFRALARLFERIEGAPLNGHRLVRVDKVRAGYRYRVQVLEP